MQPTSRVVDVDASLEQDDRDTQDKEEEESLISAKQLMSLITERSTTFFLLDTRPAADYTESHLKIPQSLSVPQVGGSWCRCRSWCLSRW